MTEIALVADLHGNLPAVEALERDLTARRIRRVWCLGDMVGKGPSSAETLDWAAARCARRMAVASGVPPSSSAACGASRLMRGT